MMAAKLEKEKNSDKMQPRELRRDGGEKAKDLRGRTRVSKGVTAMRL